MNKISVICPTYNEEKFIGNCLNSLLNQNISWDGSEILIVDGNSNDKTRDIISKYSQRYSFIRLLNNPRRNTPSGLNIGIKESKNGIIFRIDAHTQYPPNYFAILADNLIQLQADNVGGICRTLPGSKGIVPELIAKAMSSLFGMGNSFFRIGSKEIRKVDTVPFGCFKRELFDKLGFFDEELIRNQDDEFNARIIKNGGSIYLIPHVVVDYYARDNINKVSKMFYQYGLFKPLVNKKLGKPSSFRQFFPLFFLLWITFGGLICYVFHILYLYFSILILYFFLAYIFSYKESKNFLQFLIMPFIFFIIHISYGWGYIKGFIKFIILKSTFLNLETNR